MSKNVFIEWFVKLKAFYILGLVATGAWVGSKWLVTNPSWDWEPVAASLLLIGAIFGAEYAEYHEREKLKGQRDSEQDLSRYNADIRRLMAHISKLPRQEIQPGDVQDLVEMIASTLARIHFHTDELLVPKEGRQIYPDGQLLHCDVCRAKDKVTVHRTGHCPRCKFESHSWMQP